MEEGSEAALRDREGGVLRHRDLDFDCFPKDTTNLSTENPRKLRIGGIFPSRAESFCLWMGRRGRN